MHAAPVFLRYNPFGGLGSEMLNIDDILRALNEADADYLLLGGVNFLLNHEFISTEDLDIWIRDEHDNHSKVTKAAQAMGATWGPSEADWKPVPDDPKWLTRQTVFCLVTKHGAVDVFRNVLGLDDGYDACKARSLRRTTPLGASYWSLSDEDMLRCQLALTDRDRKLDRIRKLQEAIARRPKA